MKEAIRILERERRNISATLKEKRDEISELESMMLEYSNSGSKDYLTKSAIYLLEERIDSHKSELKKYNSKLEDIKNAIKLIKDNVS